MFTKEELEEMTKDTLVRLAEYYKLDDFSKYWIKDKMIQAILDEITPKPEVVDDGLPPMSERVRRIYNASHKEQ